MTAPFRIMVIDDEKVDLMLYSRMFSKLKCPQVEPIGFQYAEDALNYLEDPNQPTVDAIFVDINLPRMNGFEFLERLDFQFQNGSWPALYFLSTSMDPRDRLRSLTHEKIIEFVEKPLTQEKLQKIADRLAKL